ncbi:AAA-like domain-containing protein [Nostoc sp. TCL240-02]|uniref:AAA-like domain-containing protein n=1 Tax=Nostoc sp. TCL240-02 TaxID=2572090 RepID=UPI0020C742BB|nr:AAA-like domain-containing protein [Nostoc sp. TCL240-02]
MKPEVASRRIESFGQRFGEAHLYLTYHAAFPLALTPDLLYRLWANFQRDIQKQELKIPWLAVADLLLSSLCDEVGHELYEMDTAVRNALLRELKENPHFGEKRINELSDFLLTYVRQQLESYDPDIRDFAQAQRWTALAYTRPSQAARELALTLSKLRLEDKAEWVRMGSLMETFAEPLAEFAPLMTYTRGMVSLARGNPTKAVDELSQVIRQRQKIEVAGVNLPVPKLLIRQAVVLELPEGQVDLASAFYIERPPIEATCYKKILQPGALIRLKAPRQMGQTSLMARILHQASQHDYLTVLLSFQLADEKVFADLDQFLKWFCASVGRRLTLPNKLADYWDDIFGSKDNCTVYFEEYLLPEINQPLALGLDEVDRIFQHPEIAADFFGLLRAWHEDAKNRDIWKKLRLVVVHSTEVYIPMNINQSPFNIGLPIELPEFNAQQVLDLALRHGLNWNFTQVEQLMAMVGGHPYLVRVALYHIARKDTTLNVFLQTAPTETGPYSDHLRRHLWNLEQRPELAAAIKKVVANTSPVRLDSIQCFKLLSMGLVKFQDNEVMPFCNIYRQYFSDRFRA